MNESSYINEPHFTNPETSFAFISNDENTDEKPQNVYQKWNKFMSFKPDIPKTPVYKSKPMISKQYSQQSEVKKGKNFDNKEDLMLAVRLKALNDGFQFLTDRSAPERVHLKCYNFEQCHWKLRARLWDNTENYHITHLDDVHTCPKTQTYPNHRNANKKVIAHILNEKLQDRSRVLKGKDIQQDILSEYKIHISYQQAWRGKDYAIQQIRGSPYEAFEMLPYYCFNLERKNEGTVTRIKTDKNGVFEMLFITIGASIRTFRNYLCPVLMIDAVYLMGLYKGTNLVAVAMDGNNQIMPIAFGICKGKTGPCWTCVESVNAKSIIHIKEPVLKLAETYRAMVQEWYYKRRQLAVNLQTGICECRKWQLSGIPCGHVIAVTRFMGLTDCVQYVADWFKKPKYQGTYSESIHFLGNMSQWDFPQNIQKAIPPRMDNPQPGRPKNTNRIQSQGEEPRLIHCSRCTQAGHRRDQCNKPFVVQPPVNIRTRNDQEMPRNNQPSFHDRNQQHDNTFHTFNHYTSQQYGATTYPSQEYGETLICTDNAKIARKRSKPDKHGHGKGKRIQEPGECYQRLTKVNPW
ncbi:transposase, MuDR, MULE transposase domain protein [Tanacetum coccineum]